MPLFILTVGLIVILLLGIPAAYSMILSSMVLLGLERGFANIPHAMIAQRVFNGMDSFPLLAVPLFILVGQLMNDAGVTDRIFNFAKVFVGHFRGGLAHVNIVASLIFAGMSGSAVADAAGLGAIEIKAMTDEGYDLDFSVGVTASSSLIGPIIPPSIPVVLYAVLAGVSVTRLLIAGFIPGLIMTACLMGYVIYRAHKTEYPVRPRATMKEFQKAFKEAFFPILTPLILVGGIVSGVFTATEAAGVAALYALILFLFYKKFSLPALLKVFKDTTKTSANVMFILAAAQIYSTLVIRSRIPVTITQAVFTLTSGYWGVLLLVVLVLLVVGCFMSTSVAINILTPVLVPLVVAAGVDPLYFGIIMIVVLMIGQLTPPFGMVLFAILGICDIPFNRLVKSVMLFTIPIVISLILMLIFPRLVTFLPGFY
jgi:tripartite ATP-independent transporter DctM subunit